MALAGDRWRAGGYAARDQYLGLPSLRGDLRPVPGAGRGAGTAAARTAEHADAGRVRAGVRAGDAAQFLALLAALPALLQRGRSRPRTHSAQPVPDHSRLVPVPGCVAACLVYGGSASARPGDAAGTNAGGRARLLRHVAAGRLWHERLRVSAWL